MEEAPQLVWALVLPFLCEAPPITLFSFEIEIFRLKMLNYCNIFDFNMIIQKDYLLPDYLQIKHSLTVDLHRIKVLYIC